MCHLLSLLARELGLSNADPGFDDSLPTEDDTKDWENQVVASHVEQPDDEVVSNDDEDSEPESTQELNEDFEPEHLSLEETLKAIKKIHRTTNVSSVQPKIRAVITDLEELVVQEHIHPKKQTTIESFLSKH